MVCHGWWFWKVYNSHSVYYTYTQKHSINLISLINTETATERFYVNRSVSLKTYTLLILFFFFTMTISMFCKFATIHFLHISGKFTSSPFFEKKKNIAFHYRLSSIMNKKQFSNIILTYIILSVPILLTHRAHTHTHTHKKSQLTF